MMILYGRHIVANSCSVALTSYCLSACLGGGAERGRVVPHVYYQVGTDCV